MVVDDKKYCCTCGELLPLTKEYFHVRNTSKDGFRCDCKKCRKEKIPKRDREFKRCYFCLEMKPNNKEHFYSVVKGGLRAQCIVCHSKYQKEYNLLKNYNMALEDYERLLKEQNYKCLICDKKKKLYVDHCHKTGKVRGLLCDLCNRGIGLFKEDVNSLSRAINFLNENN